jgi:hypothetical protein
MLPGKKMTIAKSNAITTGANNKGFKLVSY